MTSQDKTLNAENNVKNHLTGNELQNIWILSIGDAFLFKYWHMHCRGNRRFTASTVKNNLCTSIHTDRNTLDLNCHFYVVEATLQSKCMCFQDYDYTVRKGAALGEKMYHASPSSPTSEMN